MEEYNLNVVTQVTIELQKCDQICFMFVTKQSDEIQRFQTFKKTMIHHIKTATSSTTTNNTTNIKTILGT